MLLAIESKWKDECYHVMHVCKCHFFLIPSPFVFVISTASLIVIQSGELEFVLESVCFFDMVNPIILLGFSKKSRNCPVIFSGGGIIQRYDV